MKKTLLITAIAALGVASAFAQGNITFKTSATKNTVFYATDGTTATLTPVSTAGAAGSFGTVNYAFLSAPTGTPGLTAADMSLLMQTGIAPAGWTSTPITGVTYNSTEGGVINGQTITTPASAGAGGSPALVEIYAWTGNLGPGFSGLYGYSGSTFNGGSVTYNWTSPALGPLTTSTGALGWSQATASTAGSPPPTPATMVAGATGLGSIVLTPVPEPGTLVLSGLGAAALLLFRRRK